MSTINMCQIRISHQKYVANELMEKLSHEFDDIIVAGGAPREWFFDRPANDIDIFVHGRSDSSALSVLLGFGLSPIGINLLQDKYPDPRFDGYEGEYSGEKIQVLMYKEPVSTIYETFPINMCQAWYRNGECGYTDDFILGATYKVLVVDRSGLINTSSFKLECKYSEEYFPDYSHNSSWEGALKRIGGMELRGVYPIYIDENGDHINF